MNQCHTCCRDYLLLLALALLPTANTALGQQGDGPDVNILWERRVTAYATRDSECIHIRRGSVTIELSVKLLRRIVEHRPTAESPPRVSEAPPLELHRRQALPFIEAYEASPKAGHECVVMHPDTVTYGMYLVSAVLQHGEATVLAGSPMQPVREYVVRRLKGRGGTITFSREGITGSFFSVVGYVY